MDASGSAKRESFRSLFFGSTSITKPPESPETAATTQKVFWPRDYLACDLKEARVWTYGYNADALKGPFRASNQNSVLQHATDLAARLKRDIDNEVSAKYYLLTYQST